MNKIYLFFAFIIWHLASSQNNYCVSDISFDYTTVSIFTTDGNIYTWGQNHYGHVGNGNTQIQNSPWLRPSVPNFTSLSHSVNHSTALANNGKIYAWGRNFFRRSRKWINYSSLHPNSNRNRQRLESR
ncbi:hypothetical protein [Chryseobacterium caseinilyticum]|uniref:Uncharacterized protein n=1 Tax=Chryseobacterium caseinilyticum TaxID=2771428 RepID=A0ABR8ZCD1_9FLAO|nr:hypothetical protein [Chryseobacterium caseinilyticum]MBD8082969.1 hypothetical protein [Chryseobacterium caseinilyticum]